MRIAFYVVWTLCSVPLGLAWSLQFTAAAAEYGLATAIGWFALKIAGAAAGAWLVYDLFLRDRPETPASGQDHEPTNIIRLHANNDPAPPAN
jgi:hypothetical protein